MSTRMVRVVIDGVVDKIVTTLEAMDWVWSEQNTEDHPLHIYDESGKEIEW